LLKRFKSILKVPAIGVISILVFIYLFMGIYKPFPFLTLINQFNILKEIVPLATISIGMTIVIIARGIDLSVGAISGLSAGICAFLLLKNLSFSLAVIITLLFGILIGFINGFLITKFNISDFILTLGVQNILRGIFYVATLGTTIVPTLSNTSRQIVLGTFLKIPIPIVIIIIFIIFFTLLLKRTQLGTDIYATGSNPAAAKIVGVNIIRVKIFSYMICGFLCSIAGVLLLLRLGAAPANLAQSYELDAIAAVLLAGTSLSGGKGNIYGSIFGAIVISLVRNALNLLGVNPLTYTLVIGLIILFAVAFEQLTNIVSRNKINVKSKTG